MKNPIVSVFSSFYSLPQEAMADFEKIIRSDSFPKNTELLKIGQTAGKMYFIQRGLARVYYYHEGMEVTDYFAIDGQFIGAVPGLATGLPSQKAIHLIEAADVCSFLMRDFDECAAKHPSLERAARKLITFAMIQEQERIQSLRFYSAKERYFELERKYPGISNRCPLKYIASYLNTTQVSISRIRAGIQ